MIRAVFLVTFLVVFLGHPVVSGTDAGSRDPLTQTHDIAFDNANRLGPMVKRRFALYAAMGARCGYADNQYAFNVALAKFAASERWILRKAAYEGWADGAAAAANGPCAVAVDGLKAADDALLASAEALPNE